MTAADLELVHEDSNRYEVIEGDLYVATQPAWQHQFVCMRLGRFLDEWNAQTGKGIALPAPGILFAEDEAVAPDIVWISQERFQQIVRADDKLHAAPELVAEVLSPGNKNEQRDRHVKLKLYARRGVHEYWILDWQQRHVEIYRRTQAALALVATLYVSDNLESPLLPAFTCQVANLFP
jgi:Uma2 family endonuclease